jgi:hypothetical protein
VCTNAGIFLTKFNFLRIDTQNPQIFRHTDLYSFMVNRRQLHKVFDSIKCDTHQNIVERNGYASEKNLVLKDCYLTLDQLAELNRGVLQRKMIALETLILKHILCSNNQDATVGDRKSGQVTMGVPMSACRVCRLTKNRCEVCNGLHGPPYYDFQITTGGKCSRCGLRGHLECLSKRHRCSDGKQDLKY